MIDKNLNTRFLIRAQSMYILDSATDADTAPYGIVKYSIRDSSGFFGLETQTLSDGSLVPMLKLLR